eukprot:Nitzschia sp. Nitz4//scaffold8_size234185//82142//86164//NITZ4_001252-RA/size234185-processed-gene-0.110-mRNA-1//1//CDS//3329559791//5061//frame0
MSSSSGCSSSKCYRRAGNVTSNSCSPCLCTLERELGDIEFGSLVTADTNKSLTSSMESISVVELAISGMTCSMCSDSVKRGLQDLDGVRQVSVSLATNLARIEYIESETCNATSLKDEVEDLGYDVTDTLFPNAPTIPSQPAFQEIELSIGGMTCSMCTSAVHKALTDMPGVSSVSVTLSTNSARVAFVESPECTAELIREMVDDIGYDVLDVSSVHRTDFSEGKETSSAEKSHQEDRLKRVLKQQEAHLSERKRQFILCLLGTLPIVTITMALPKILNTNSCLMAFLKGSMDIFGRQFIRESLILWVLATLVQFGSGYSCYKTAFYGVSRGVYGMDVLVSLGMTASYVYAAMATWKAEPGYHFFETSVVLLSFVLLGKWMNAVAVCRTSDALTSLMKLQVKTALRVSPIDPVDRHWDPETDHYTEETVPIEHIVPGDIVKVLKGSAIPADGEVLFGEICVDESMFTGESIPVLKMVGTKVLGGTICADSGKESAFVRVTGVGSSTALAQIVQLVQDAQSSQVPIQTLADNISSVFVPTVIIISVLTFCIWYGCCMGGVVPDSWYGNESPATFSMLFGIACLVISCPCALGLATPTAVMVGTGVAAQLGILMKGGETLEMAGNIDTVVFDKTGTLTQGRPAVTDFVRVVPESTLQQLAPSSDMSGDDYLLWLLASLERNSEHPVAKALVAHVEDRFWSLHREKRSFAEPKHFQSVTGRGASGVIQGNISVCVGNRAFAEHQHLTVSEEVEKKMQQLEEGGKTAIVAGVNGEICAVLGVADALKDDAVTSVCFLKEMGIDVWLVTGDSERTAAAIAAALSIPGDRVIAEALPADKVDQVKRLQVEGRRVAMVGDGVNDSPALTVADVGVAMGTGAEIATEAADMVLISGKVSDACTALDLSMVIFQRIQGNLIFSLVYNLLSIPLAAGLFFPLFHTRLPPTVAAIAMSLSSVSVVMNSLSLRWHNGAIWSLRSSLTRQDNARNNQSANNLTMASHDLHFTVSQNGVEDPSALHDSPAMPNTAAPASYSTGIFSSLQASAHPTVCIFHVLFKAAALTLYIFGGLFTGNGNGGTSSANFITVTVCCMLLLAADFWVVKNITGRLLVGLRWWNKVEGDTTTWIFESAQNKNVNTFDSSFFWTVLYVTPLLWSGLLVIGILKFILGWLIIVCMALSLSIANVYGYYKCSSDQKAQLQQMMQKGAQQGAMSVLRSNMLGYLAGTPQTTSNVV